MKKEMLIIDFVFGEEYQGYIPIFLYSLYKHYPDYDAMIYVDRKLKKETQMLLKEIPGNGEKYKIVLVNRFVRKLSSGQKAAYRYLLYDPVFEQYKYLYIGDIDFYICKESIPLHKQHISHMNKQGLVYSNMVRNYTAMPGLISRYENILKKAKLYKLAKNCYFKYFYHKRLTGLHFVDIDKYYKAIEKQRKKFLKVFYDADIMSELYNWKMKLYSDEELLYYIIKKSYLALPEHNNFRPHHGLHFGMWRGLKRADPAYDQYIQSQLFRDYYSQFKEELEQDGVLQEIIKRSPVRIKKIINTMIYDIGGRAEISYCREINS